MGGRPGARPGGALCGLVCIVAGLAPLAGADDSLTPEILEDFARLWQLVIVEKAARNVPMDNVPDVRRACLYGLGATTRGVARFLLEGAQPALEALEVLDVEEPAMQALLGPLAAELGSRLEEAPKASLADLGDPGAPVPAASPLRPPACDLAVISQNSTQFTLERLLHRSSGQRYVAVAWLSVGCLTPDGNTTSSYCGFLNAFWDKTLLMRRGYCFRHVCMSRVPVDGLRDPNVFPLDCEGLAGARGAAAARAWASPSAEFAQDWYVAWNFFSEAGPPRSWSEEGAEDAAPPRLMRGGLYVDVGASLPFEYSNTVAFDRCLAWRGLCIEANPGLLPWLRNYRTCAVVNNCVTEHADSDRAFRGRDGEFAFSVDCLPLREILSRAGLQGQRIDVMSIDVEHGELGVLRGFDLQDYDIAVMIIEVGHGARWLEVETEVLQFGYAKVAVLGRDVVYARLDLIRERLGAVGKVSWRQFAGSFLPGYAGGDDMERPLPAAKQRCEGLGELCGGVTCSSEQSSCTVRAGHGSPYESPAAEVTHAKAGMPLAVHGRVLLPDDWQRFHSRVVREELEHEQARERELTRRGMRRPWAAVA